MRVRGIIEALRETGRLVAMLLRCAALNFRLG
jgi:hypothetical protein